MLKSYALQKPVKPSMDLGLTHDRYLQKPGLYVTIKKCKYLKPIR